MAEQNPAQEVVLSQVWRDFCGQLAEAGSLLDRPSSPRTPIDQAEGLRYLSRMVRTALNMLVDSSDPDFPRIFLLTDDTIKIGADNPDNLYQQIVVRGDREYRIWGKRGTVPYLSIGSKANRYAIERVKQIAPIWKREFFEGGDVWIEGATADPDDQRAREDAERIACA